MTNSSVFSFSKWNCRKKKRILYIFNCSKIIF